MNKYTHYGWFGFCPVYINDPWGRAPGVVARRAWLHPLLELNVFLQQSAIVCCALINPEWIPTWKIRLSGKLEQPVSC